jgi:uncharacterized RDD family membrane protein YckC
MQLNDPNSPYNPYSPPAAGAAYNAPGGNYYGDQVLADRGTRFGAALLDGLLALVCAIPGGALLFFQAFNSASTRHGRANAFEPADLIGGIVLMMALALPLAIYQWYLITKSGQSLGKRWTGIKIVKLDGSPVDFVSGVVMRIWVVAAIGMVPYVGSCVSIVDPLMIFGDERRCLHDLIAGTKVIVAMPS